MYYTVTFLGGSNPSTGQYVLTFATPDYADDGSYYCKAAYDDGNGVTNEMSSSEVRLYVRSKLNM